MSIAADTENAVPASVCRTIESEITAMDMKLEVVILPVSDVDRAKGFYVEQLGWRLDADFPINDGYRIVQVTPPGSECSIIFGQGLTQQEPGTLHGLQRPSPTSSRPRRS